MAKLDPAGPRPLYLQLADYLRRQIDIDAWQPNTRLPPKVDLAAQFNVRRGMVRQAMDLLVNQGLLQRTPGKGTFVTVPNPHASSRLSGTVAQPKYEIGAHAAQMLLDQIASVGQAQCEVVWPTTLIIRDSANLTVAMPAGAAAVGTHPSS